MRLAGKVAIITGTAGGQGALAARLFTAEGARVVACDVDAAGELVASEIRATGAIIDWMRCDVSREDDVERLISESVAHHGRIDILYNNAGIERGDGPITNLSVEAWDRIQAVNARGVFLTCKHVIPVMLEQQAGSIINVASVTGLVGVPGLSAYPASKGAVIALSRSLAVSYGRFGIRVNVLCPGLTLTPMAERLGTDFMERVTGLTPMKRLAKPEEIIQVALFLASDEASYVTGAVLPADGGRTAE